MSGGIFDIHATEILRCCGITKSTFRAGRVGGVWCVWIRGRGVGGLHGDAVLGE